MGQFDASIVTVALPTLQRTFHSTVGAVTWVGLSYLLVLVATVVAVGRLADMWGRKLLYVYGFAIFIIGSTLCALAPDLGWLIGFRALQAIGAALLQANSVAIILLAVPKPSLGRAIGIQGAAQAIGLALGPTTGGFLLAAGGWRLIFFVNVPFGLVGMIAGVLLIPRSRNLQDAKPFDWLGFFLFLPAVVALFTAISFGNVPAGVAIDRRASCGWVEPCRGVPPPRAARRGAHARSSAVPTGTLQGRDHERFAVLPGDVRSPVPRALLPRARNRLRLGRSGLELMVMPVALVRRRRSPVGLPITLEHVRSQ